MPHTEGPWAYDPSTSHIVSTTSFEDWSLGIEDQDPVPSRVICTYGAMGGDTVSDLALLVASPELLEVVTSLESALSSDDADALRKARARARNVVARASGRSPMKTVAVP